MKYKKFFIGFTGILLGFLIILQSRSFSEVQNLYGRDSRANAFKEIQILKRTNDNLLEEIKDLEKKLENSTDQEETLQLIKDEIHKNRIIAGYLDIQGSGIELIISSAENMQVIWLTDILNELWSAGAEAISINDIRITNRSIGFDVLPKGQISLNGNILKSPYVFKIIGDQKVIREALYQKNGILERMKENLPEIEIASTLNEQILMKKVEE